MTKIQFHDIEDVRKSVTSPRRWIAWCTCGRRFEAASRNTAFALAERHEAQALEGSN